jgi:hypothetical protein
VPPFDVPPFGAPPLGVAAASSAFPLVAWFSHAPLADAHKNKIDSAKSHERSRMLLKAMASNAFEQRIRRFDWLLFGVPSRAFFEIV